MLKELGAYDNPQRVKRGIAECLGVCAGGPLLVVYPDGIWYHHVDKIALQRIIDEHLRENKPVAEYVFHGLAGE
jgi:(2Fe-2S) ferredoxin